MKHALLLGLLLLAVPAVAAPHFTAIDVYLDTDVPFAAWQFELRETSHRMTVVGIENGASDAYPRAPYYDRDAVAQGNANRIVVADFSTMETRTLPSGNVRIATVHIMLETDEPRFQLSLISAVSSNGEVIDATISYRTQ